MNAKHRKSNVVTRKPEPDLDKLQQTSSIGLICIVSFKCPSIVLCCWGVLKSSLCGFCHLTSSTCQGTSTILRDHLVPKGLPPPQLLRWEGKDRHKQPVSTYHFNIHCTNRQGSSLNFVACLLKSSRLNYSGSQMESPNSNCVYVKYWGPTNCHIPEHLKSVHHIWPIPWGSAELSPALDAQRHSGREWVDAFVWPDWGLNPRLPVSQCLQPLGVFCSLRSCGSVHP